MGCFDKDANGNGANGFDFKLETLPLTAGGHDERLEVCAQQCADYTYMGLTWYDECWCDNSYGKYGRPSGLSSTSCIECSLPPTHNVSFTKQHLPSLSQIVNLTVHSRVKMPMLIFVCAT